MACKNSEVNKKIELFKYSRIYYLKFLLVLALPDEGPRIYGGKPRYQAGDVVQVNCTSGRSKPAATLSWYINGEQVKFFTSELI